jgi:hypothetical protein
LANLVLAICLFSICTVLPSLNEKRAQARLRKKQCRKESVVGVLKAKAWHEARRRGPGWARVGGGLGPIMVTAAWNNVGQRVRRA